MSLWINDYIETNGIHIHYYRTGGAKTPILLLHGITDSGNCWTPVARQLEHAYDVIMLDARGHGLSDPPTTGFSTALLAADVTGAILALGLENVFLLGHSMGATTAALVAQHHPELVRALLLEDPPWVGPVTPAPDERLARNWEEGVRLNQQYSASELLMIARAHNPRWSSDELEQWVEAQKQLNLAIFQPGFSQAISEMQTTVQHLTCPALLVTGDANLGAYVTPEIAQEALSTWNTGEIVHISNAGHCIRRDRFSPFMVAVTSFLKRH